MGLGWESEGVNSACEQAAEVLSVAGANSCGSVLRFSLSPLPADLLQHQTQIPTGKLPLTMNIGACSSIVEPEGCSNILVYERPVAMQITDGNPVIVDSCS